MLIKFYSLKICKLKKLIEKEIFLPYSILTLRSLLTPFHSFFSITFQLELLLELYYKNAQNETFLWLLTLHIQFSPYV